MSTPTPTPTQRDEQGRELGLVRINNQHYLRPVIHVAVVTLDGTSCTVPVGDLLDMLGDGNEYSVRLKTMSLREFERMPEFQGF